MKDSDVGLEIIAAESQDPTLQRNAINRRELLIGTAGVIALTLT